MSSNETDWQAIAERSNLRLMQLKSLSEDEGTCKKPDLSEGERAICEEIDNVLWEWEPLPMS